MSRPLLPPRGIFTGTSWLFDPDLSPNVKETLLQLMALTWGKEGHISPPLSYAQLEALTGKNARTLRGHLSALRSYQAALRLQPAGPGQFIIALAPWLFSNTIPQAAANLPDGKVLPQPDQYDQIQEEESSRSIEREFLDLPDDHDQAPGKTAQKASGSPGKPPAPAASGLPAPAARALSKKLQARLSQAGVFPVLLAEVATRAAAGRYSDADLTALLEWCADDQPDRAAALFVGRLRAGARAPSLYRTPPCKRCGQRGKHAQDCLERYGPMDF